jgi:hypothetical protein
LILTYSSGINKLEQREAAEKTLDIPVALIYIDAIPRYKEVLTA